MSTTTLAIRAVDRFIKCLCISVDVNSKAISYTLCNIRNIFLDILLLALYLLIELIAINVSKNCIYYLTVHAILNRRQFGYSIKSLIWSQHLATRLTSNLM